MKYVKYSFLLLIAVFSFFISDKVLLYVENLNPIMKQIDNIKDEYKVESVNALIDGNTIIPGKKGKIVNARESYLKMRDFKKFNDTFLIYDYVEPEISLMNNLDKIIIKGNKDNSVSIIITNNSLDQYLIENKINYNKIIDKKEDYKTNEMVEYIDVNRNIDLKLKNNICLIGYSDVKYCKKKKKFLVMPSQEISLSNLYKINNISSGDIILIDQNIDLANFKIILNKIKSKNLHIIKIGELISE